MGARSKERGGKGAEEQPGAREGFRAKENGCSLRRASRIRFFISMSDRHSRSLPSLRRSSLPSRTSGAADYSAFNASFRAFTSTSASMP